MNKKIFSQPFFVLLCCVVFFKPILFWNRFPFNICLHLAQIVVWTLIGIVSLERIRQWKNYLYVWTAFSVMSIISTLLYKSETQMVSLELELSFLFLMHFLDILFSLKRIRCLKALWIYLFISEFFELITIPLYQRGMISVAWFGIKTRSTDAAIPFILLSIFLRGVVGKFFSNIAILIATLTIILCRNTTGIIALLIIGCSVFIIYRRNFVSVFHRLHPIVIIGTPVLSTIAIVFWRFQSKFLLFLRILKGDADMAATMSGRTEFWPNGIQYLQMTKGYIRFFGTGFHNAERFCYWRRMDRFLEAHCMILQLLHDNGIFGTVIFYLTVYLLIKNVKKCEDKNHRQLIIIFAFTYLFICITEIYCYYSYFYIIFLMAARAHEISDCIRGFEKEKIK